MDKAVLIVHGSVASSWKQVAGFLTGDAHDRSKVQVLVDGKFYDVSIDSEDTK